MTEPRALEGSGTDQVFVVFSPSGRRGLVPAGTSVLEAARHLGVDLDSVCGGRALCGRCQVVFTPGDFPKFQVSAGPGALTTPGDAETRYAGRRRLAPDRRLGCSAQLLTDAVIDVPPESQVHRQVIRKRAEAREIEVRPVTRLHYVEVARPDLEVPASDLRRLCTSLADQWPGLGDDMTCDAHVLGTLQKTLRDGDWKVTVALRGGDHIVAVWPGLRERVLGLALDIGSTTMSAHLCDLATGEVLASSGAMNPQIRFGEDLMSRVSWAMMNPGGAADMTRVVREAATGLAGETAREAGAEPDDILEVVMVGNPVMHHLMLGIDPSELGFAPFALAVDRAVETRAAELDIALHPGTRVYAPACIAGHVGADAAAVILSEGPYRRDDMTLIIDVGTNAEIVLGNRHRLLACSSPTGPAFEGAQISSGQRAAPGAIERVRIDRTTLEPRFRIIGVDAWSNEPEFPTDARITGICGSGIIEALAELFLAGLMTADGTIDGTCRERTDRMFADGRTFSWRLAGDICVTQADVRAIQLAKAALYAGSRLLMDRLEIDTVDRVVLAGAFGSHIDTTHAMVLGMIPDCQPDRVYSAGNAAGTGARIALLDNEARREIEQVVRRVEKIETATEPRFQEHFVDAMAFPHRTDPYRRLRRLVDLPEPRAPAAQSTARRRRRR